MCGWAGNGATTRTFTTACSTVQGPGKQECCCSPFPPARPSGPTVLRFCPARSAFARAGSFRDPMCGPTGRSRPGPRSLKMTSFASACCIATYASLGGNDYRVHLSARLNENRSAWRLQMPVFAEPTRCHRSLKSKISATPTRGAGVVSDGIGSLTDNFHAKRQIAYHLPLQCDAVPAWTDESASSVIGSLRNNGPAVAESRRSV